MVKTHYTLRKAPELKLRVVVMELQVQVLVQVQELAPEWDLVLVWAQSREQEQARALLQVTHIIGLTLKQGKNYLSTDNVGFGVFLGHLYTILNFKPMSDVTL